MSGLEIGDEVEVEDEGLAMLRRICPKMPPNHHGRVESVHNDIVMVEFPIDGGYDHSQIAPYPIAKVSLRPS